MSFMQWITKPLVVYAKFKHTSLSIDALIPQEYKGAQALVWLAVFLARRMLGTQPQNNHRSEQARAQSSSSASVALPRVRRQILRNNHFLLPIFSRAREIRLS